MIVEELFARESIRHTLASYTIAGDRLREDDFAAVFTEDAILESEGVQHDDKFRYASKAEIREWIGRWRNPPGGVSTHAATFVRHHLSTSLIEFTDANTAKARTYWTAYTDIGPDHCGYYLDTLRREGERWLIAHRRVRLDWRSPQSLFRTAVSNSRA